MEKRAPPSAGREPNAAGDLALHGYPRSSNSLLDGSGNRCLLRVDAHSPVAGLDEWDLRFDTGLEPTAMALLAICSAVLRVLPDAALEGRA